jgi:HD superfamily phosphodiesterase
MPGEHVDEAVVSWAAREAGTRLAPLGDRWRHVEGVAARARWVIPILPPADQHCLVAAAYLHDIGWAPELVETGFHPIDGARWVRHQGLERLARLVAHHSAARYEAELLGLAAALREFEAEDSATADALAYCDLTTGPAGDQVRPAERWAEIMERYGPDHVSVAALALARPSLEAAVSRTEERLRAGNAQPM